MIDIAYRRVAEDLRSAIAAGEYPAGSQLPSESELMRRYGVSRGTIRQTYSQLLRQGLISSRQGSRRMVVDTQRVQSFEDVTSFSLWVRSMGGIPSGKVIRLERREANEEECQKLSLASGAAVFYMMRLRFMSGKPAMVERSAYPEEIGRIVAGLDLENESVIERLAAEGYTIARAEHTIDALSAGREDARFLDVAVRTPLLRDRRVSLNAAGRPLEYTEDRYRADVVSFTIGNSLQVNHLSRRSSQQTAKMLGRP
jgi:GntR family transcriptional regulator